MGPDRKTGQELSALIQVAQVRTQSRELANSRGARAENPGEERQVGGPVRMPTAARDRAQPLSSTRPVPGRLADTAQALPPGILRPPRA